MLAKKPRKFYCHLAKISIFPNGLLYKDNDRADIFSLTPKNGPWFQGSHKMTVALYT